MLALLTWADVYFFSKPVTCFDNLQNNGETGVDCGGPCARLCTADVHAPIVAWARSFETATSTYTAAAYIQNPNTGAAAYGVHYAFRLFDSNNILVVERDGVIDLPPQPTVPIIEPNIIAGNRAVAHAFLEFSGDITWTKVPQTVLPSVHITNQQLSPDGSQLSATVVNDGNTTVHGLTVAAVLFDASDNAEEASKSAVPDIPAGVSEQVVFTWPTSSVPIVRAELTPIPALPPLQTP